jgi:hypothetical protein
MAMKLWRKILTSVAVAGMAAGAGAYYWRGEIVLALMQRSIVRAMAANPIASLRGVGRGPSSVCNRCR